MGLFVRLIERVLELFIERKMQKYRPRMGGGGQNLFQLLTDSYNSGQYPNALSMCEMATSCGMEMGPLRADLLMQVDRFDEAAQALTKYLAMEKEPKSMALAQCVFGDLLLLQHRFDEALERFTRALNLWPDRGATHRSIAEVWLRRGSDAPQALRWAQQAIEKENAEPGVTPETKAANRSMQSATLAWALAASSKDTAEVERLAAEAIGLFSGVAVSSRARVYILIGMAYAEHRNAPKCIEHLENAGRVDPLGAWGREAQKMAAEIKAMV